MFSSAPIFAIFDVGGGEMILIFLVVLMLFGGQRMPELARGLGKSIREFKKVTSGVEQQIKQAMDDVEETTHSVKRAALAPPPTRPKAIAPIDPTPAADNVPPASAAPADPSSLPPPPPSDRNA